MVMEIVLTAILVSVILHTATGYRSIGHNAALAVGSTVALLGLFASPISGASMNPARTLGPDIVSLDFTGWWVYIVGPLVGAAIALALISLVRGVPDKEEREAAEGGASRWPGKRGVARHATCPDQRRPASVAKAVGGPSSRRARTARAHASGVSSAVSTSRS